MDGRTADEWWHSLPIERRIGYCKWLRDGTRDYTVHPPVEGQYELPLEKPHRTTRPRTKRR